MDSDADAVATFADVWARQVFPFFQDDYEELLQTCPLRLKEKQEDKKKKKKGEKDDEKDDETDDEKDKKQQKDVAQKKRQEELNQMTAQYR